MKFKKVDFIDFEPKNNLTKKVWLILLMFLAVNFVYNIVIVFASMPVGVIYGIINRSPDMEAFMQSDLINIFSLFVTVFAIIISLFYVKVVEQRKLSTTGITKQGAFAQYGIGYLIGILMIALPALALLLFSGSISLNADANYGILLLYFLGFLVQGASEEVMVRGYLFTSLAKAGNLFWAVTISSVGFAALHLLNPSMGLLPFINLALFGVFACFFFLRTKNIWAISAIHSAWNFFQGNVFGIEVSGKVLSNSVFNIQSSCPAILSGGDFGLEGGLMVTALLIGAILLTMFAGENKLVEQNATEEETI